MAQGDEDARRLLAGLETDLASAQSLLGEAGATHAIRSADLRQQRRDEVHQSDLFFEAQWRRLNEEREQREATINSAYEARLKDLPSWSIVAEATKHVAACSEVVDELRKAIAIVDERNAAARLLQLWRWRIYSTTKTQRKELCRRFEREIRAVDRIGVQRCPNPNDPENWLSAHVGVRIWYITAPEPDPPQPISQARPSALSGTGGGEEAMMGYISRRSPESLSHHHDDSSLVRRVTIELPNGRYPKGRLWLGTNERRPHPPDEDWDNGDGTVDVCRLGWFLLRYGHLARCASDARYALSFTNGWDQLREWVPRLEHRWLWKWSTSPWKLWGTAWLPTRHLSNKHRERVRLLLDAFSPLPTVLQRIVVKLL